MGFKFTNRYGRYERPESYLTEKKSGIGNKTSYYYHDLSKDGVNKYDGMMRPQPFSSQDLHKGSIKESRPNEVQEHYRKLGEYYKRKYGV